MFYLPGSVFISYSRKDNDLVIPVVRAQKVLERVAFIDHEDTPPGAHWEEHHSSKIAGAERLVIFWSVHSAVSPNVEREWRLALK